MQSFALVEVLEDLVWSLKQSFCSVRGVRQQGISKTGPWSPLDCKNLPWYGIPSQVGY